jgi:hypothetical protein
MAQRKPETQWSSGPNADEEPVFGAYKGARVLFSLGQLSGPITLFLWTGRSHTSPRVPFRRVKS